MSKWHTTSFCENCAKEWCCTKECKYHLLHRIKVAREKIYNLVDLSSPMAQQTQIEMLFNNKVLNILDKLIEESKE